MTVIKENLYRCLASKPEEPIFDYPSNKYNDFANILQESFICMTSKNASAVRFADAKQGFFGQGVAARMVFLVCEKFSQPHQVKFVALELFDKFMLKHIEELHQHVSLDSSSLAAKQQDWRIIVRRVSRQLCLRIVTCCQIASKLNSHYKVISVRDAISFLLLLGQSYTTESVLQSELRILRTLNYQVAVISTLDYIETLLQVLDHNAQGMQLPLSAFHSASVSMLSVLHLRLDDICRDFLHRSSPNVSSEEYDMMSEVQADKLFLASAVIAGAAYISGMKDGETVVDQIHSATNIPHRHLAHFAAALLHAVANTP